jgi:hypothetical protein
MFFGACKSRLVSGSAKEGNFEVDDDEANVPHNQPHFFNSLRRKPHLVNT